MSPRLWPLVLAGGLGLGVAAEWIAYDGDAALTAADAAVGIGLIGSGVVAWIRASQSRVGPILAATGYAWFLGTFGGWALFLHRGFLAHLMLTYPTGRARSGVERVSIAAAYAYAAIYPIAASEYATIAFAAGLVGVCSYRYGAAGGPQRRAGLSAVGAAVAFGFVLVLSAATQLAGAGGDRTVLWLYDAVVLLAGLGLTADLLLARWAQSTVTGLVIDLGDPGSAGTLRERLVRALGDPSLVVAYYLPEDGRYVDETGRPFELPVADETRAVTEIDEDGKPVAVLVHDPVVLDDPELVRAAASAARLVVSNVRLQAEIQALVAEVEASRLRLVQAADAQRRSLERELRDGPARRLGRMAALLAECGPEMAGARDELDAARSSVRELARGIHPAALTDRGLASALEELAARAPIPVDVEVSSGRWPPIVEAAVYFLCAEALTNVAKYAEASRARIRLFERGGRLCVAVSDDGLGGADPSRGTGLRGLADRVEALGGALRLTSDPGAGTDIVAEVPLR